MAQKVWKGKIGVHKLEEEQIVTFRNMTAEEFCSYRESSIVDYAEDLTKGQSISREKNNVQKAKRFLPISNKAGIIKKLIKYREDKGTESNV